MLCHTPWDFNIYRHCTRDVDVGRGYCSRGRERGDRHAMHINCTFCNAVCLKERTRPSGNGFKKWNGCNRFDIVCTVHRNQLYIQTNKMHFPYLFILQFLYDSTRFERPFRSSSGVHDLLYSAAVYKPCFAWFVHSCTKIVE